MAALLSCFVVILTAATVFGKTTPRYTRTVHYEEDILVKCAGLRRQTIDELMISEGIDVWKVQPEGKVDFRVSRDMFRKMDKRFSSCKEADNIEEIVRRAEQKIVKKHTNQTQVAEWFKEYHPYEEIVEWWRKLSEDYPDEVNFEETIGQSYEGRNIPVVTITSAVNEPNTVYFQCQIHAREWISGATCMYVVNYLLENKDTNERVSGILEQVKLVVIPFVNPDGYEYTWNVNRLWRKNRRPGLMCDGVDLNRNFKEHWGEDGSSGNPCSETYHGAEAESEPETQNIVNYFKSLQNVVGALDWHSFGQLILRRYGWTMVDCPDEARLKSLGDAMVEHIRNVNGRIYTSQKSSQLYTSSGTASDWFYSDDGNENNAYRAAGYTIELRDTGQYGFELPPEEIIPTGEELIPAVLRFIEELNETPLQK